MEGLDGLSPPEELDGDDLEGRDDDSPGAEAPASPVACTVFRDADPVPGGGATRWDLTSAEPDEATSPSDAFPRTVDETGSGLGSAATTGGGGLGSAATT
ncbi:MAG TPA: hypothetical protein DFR83_15010, partial [Deltaproteobacteria bacterium]|nr:hypothetical protein [Deltaproteobacteria bacterium]